MKNIFMNLVDETLPVIPVIDIDINEDESELFNESVNEVSMTALLENESMDVDEYVEYGFPDVADVLNTHSV